MSGDLAGDRFGGGRPVRSDGAAKVTGRARYTADGTYGEELHAVIVGSPAPNGRIARVGTAAARAVPGVRAVLTAEDVLSASGPVRAAGLRYGMFLRDRPMLAEHDVSYIGEPVAIVVAADRATAEMARALVEVDVEPEPAVFTIDEAIVAGAPIVHAQAFDLEPRQGRQLEFAFGSSNIVYRYADSVGDPGTAISGADLVFEDEYTFQSVYQYAMEPFVAIAIADERHARIHSSAQHPYQVQRDVARLFDYALANVHVHVAYIGGGFGSKSFTTIEPVVVAASRAVGAPVRLELDVEESMLVSRRHGMQARLRSGVDASGTIVGHQAELFLDTGAYALTGPAVAGRAAVRSLGAYRLPNYSVVSSLVTTNLSPAGSFRAIGGPQGAWAMECHMTHLARRLGIDPTEFRARHLAEPGERFRRGRRPLDASVRDAIRAVTEAAGDAGPVDASSLGEGTWRVGVGVAIGVADPGTSPVSTAVVKVAADGSASVLVGTSELGQGSHTVLRQVASETLEIRFEDVSIGQPDTGTGPFDFSTGSSRSTTMSGLAVHRACRALCERAIGIAADHWEVDRSGLTFAGGRVEERSGERRTMSLAACVSTHFGEPAGSLIAVGEVTAREFAETPYFWETSVGRATVAVDLETGTVRVLRYACASDLGHVMNHVLMEGQEEGAVVQGIGHTLLEELEWAGGQLLTAGLTEYQVPRAHDAPAVIASRFIENGDGPGPFGAKGGGEAAIMPVAPAIAAAIEDATGVWLTHLPLTPERVWQALRGAGAAPRVS